MFTFENEAGEWVARLCGAVVYHDPDRDTVVRYMRLQHTRFIDETVETAFHAMFPAPPPCGREYEEEENQEALGL